MLNHLNRVLLSMDGQVRTKLTCSIATSRITSTAGCSQKRCGYTSTWLCSTHKCGCSVAKLSCSILCECRGADGWYNDQTRLVSANNTNKPMNTVITNILNDDRVSSIRFMIIYPIDDTHSLLLLLDSWPQKIWVLTPRYVSYIFSVYIHIYE